ncbi:MAG TPA: MarR family transcriptional regulator [Deltaproteobacteria bacterium]|nr:MarR family transcriptional regulator [Deltaproteobacteria bacterium]
MKNQRQGAFLIAKMHHLAGRIFARKLKEYNIDNFSPAQGRIMFALWRHDNISIQELSLATQLKKSTLTSMLDRLEEAGHIRRVPSDSDRRKIMIVLTAKDRDLQRVYADVSREVTELFYRGFSHQEIDTFEEFLLRIFNNILEAEKSSAGNQSASGAEE